MTMTIQHAGPADAAQLADLIQALLTELSDGQAPDRDALHQTTTRLLQDDAIIAFIARDGDTPVAALTLHQCAAIYAGGRFGEISELYVLPGHRSSGVAAKLLQQARQYGREQGWQRLEVGAPTQPQWQRTLALYEREGFLVTGPRLRQLL